MYCLCNNLTDRIMHHLQSSVHSQVSLDEFHKGGLYRVPSSTASQRLSNQDIIAHRLEALVREYSKTIKANKPVIEQLECQRRFFRRICEKQKEKLQQVDLNLLRGEYEQQISQMRQKRNKMHEMISRLHEEAEQKKAIFYQMSHCLANNTLFLEASLHEIEEENSKYAYILQEKREIVKVEEQRLLMNAEIITEKERIQQKYNLVREEIQKKENCSYFKANQDNVSSITVILNSQA